ncbi:MAG: polysaccharide deacetylase family protein [Geminicoccaceae bacterium]
MNVAQRLGLPADAKVVVPHVDDVGMSHGANGAFLELAGRGFITCGSVMVPCPWFLEAAGMAASRPELDLGVHLTLTSEWTHYRWRPLTGASKASGLVDDEGFMWRKAKDVCDNAVPDAIEAELRAQIETAIANGIKPSHLDCHMGTALAEPFTDTYLKLGRDYRIPVLFPRTWSNYGCGLRLPSPAEDTQSRRIAALEAIGLPVVDKFIETPWVPRAESDEAYDRIIEGIEPGLSFMAVHPNLSGDIEVIDPPRAHCRVDEVRIFGSSRFLDHVRASGVHLISFRDLHRIFPPERMADLH